jgi:hypothetical protein
MVDQVNLKWNDFEENVKIAFKDFREILNDVVLYCGNQKTFANRLVLCACSEVFKSMLLATDMSTQIYPSILLWDTNINELNQILDFMYFGEVKVTEPGLASFLALAERLQVKGLCGKDGTPPRPPPEPLSPPHRPSPKRVYPVLEEISGNEERKSDWSSTKRSRTDATLTPTGRTPTARKQNNHHTSSIGETGEEIKQELVPLDFQQIMSEGTDIASYEAYDSFNDSTDQNQRWNPEGTDEEGVNRCNLCGKCYKSAGSLKNHRSLYHRDLITNRRKPAEVDVGHEMQL